MDIPVLVEQLPDRRYRARSGGPFGLSAEGGSYDEALGNLDRLMREQMAAGAKLDVVRLNSVAENPWVAGAGCLKDDPFFDDWVEAMRENRRQMDADLDH
jgi:hypothetical protein